MVGFTKKVTMKKIANELDISLLLEYCLLALVLMNNVLVMVDIEQNIETGGIYKYVCMVFSMDVN